MSTPLYDQIREFAHTDPMRLHMPGHKGKFLPIPELAPLAPLDFTEIGPTGNLLDGGEPFEQAQQLWARAAGFEGCQFLTGGSTLGLHAALTLCCRPGEEILLDRGCHRAVYNAVALLDLRPVYLERPWLAEEGIAGEISPQAVEKKLEQHPNVKTFCMTSPTYCGVLSDTEKISRMLHTRGGKLIVDGAHGAHLPFLGVDAFSGADLVVMSAHKTLPAMGQSALLCWRGFQGEQVRWAVSIYSTSSPSYPISISLDGARAWMQGPGLGEYQRTARRVARLRRRFPSLDEPFLRLDPTRLTLGVKDGPAFARRLEEENIWCEMEDGGHVVMILSGLDSEGDLDRLEEVLSTLEGEMGTCPPLPAPPLPRQVMSPRRALFSQVEKLPLFQCEGQVSAGQIAPYPPGVPVVAPGEEISKKELAYLKKIGYNNAIVPVVAQK